MSIFSEPGMLCNSTSFSLCCREIFCSSFISVLRTNSETRIVYLNSSRKVSPVFNIQLLAISNRNCLNFFSTLGLSWSFEWLLVCTLYSLTSESILVPVPHTLQYRVNLLLRSALRSVQRSVVQSVLIMFLLEEKRQTLYHQGGLFWPSRSDLPDCPIHVLLWWKVFYAVLVPTGPIASASIVCSKKRPVIGLGTCPLQIKLAWSPVGIYRVLSNDLLCRTFEIVPRSWQCLNFWH